MVRKTHGLTKVAWDEIGWRGKIHHQLLRKSKVSHPPQPRQHGKVSDLVST